MSRPPPLLRPGPALAAALLLCACQPVTSMDQRHSTRAGATPEFKRNPNPVQAYEITARINDAPGPFNVVRGFAQYSAPNCTYILDTVAGVRAMPEHTLPVDFVTAGDHIYVGTVHLDAMLDDNYFDEGVCRWILTTARIELSAGQTRADSIFVSWLDRAQVESGATSISHLQKRFYPRDTTIEAMLISPMRRDLEISDETFQIKLDSRGS